LGREVTIPRGVGREEDTARRSEGAKHENERGVGTSCIENTAEVSE